MNTKKRIDGDYYIETINADDRVYIDTNTLEVEGNLVVSGNITYINTEILDVKDPFIVVNTSNTATYAANSGLITHKTSSTYAGLRYSQSDNEWQISLDTNSDGDSGTWAAITTGASVVPGGANTYIQFNDGGSFGGNVNFTIDYSTSEMGVTGNINLDGPLQLADQSSAPASVANTTVLYGNTAGSGGTGVYFVDGSTSDELVSKSKAIVYGIIF